MNKRIAILTFYFAHNYGAMLQAYALKKYLEDLDNIVDIIPYYPEYLKQGYTISPFLSGLSIRRRIYNTLLYLKRYQQAKKFEMFKKKLITEEEFSDKNTLIKLIASYDIVVFGSDQIWNDKIIGEDSTYFGAGINSTKISYAASLGVKNLSDNQKENIKKYLPRFQAVSVREENGRQHVHKYISDVKVVCDPVFLLSLKKWEEMEKSVEIPPKYILLYLLENNRTLYEYGKNYAKINHMDLCEIHPTRGICHFGAKQMKNIGPEEFLYLIKNASVVCTNSFHAVAFCIIYQKKLIHIPNSSSPERSVFILEKAGKKIITNNHGGIPLYEFNNINVTFNIFIQKSKLYIENSII